MWHTEMRFKFVSLRAQTHSTHTRLSCKQHASKAFISTTMTPIDNALAELVSSEAPNISATARAYGIHSSTLNRRWNGRSIPKEEALSDRRFLSTQQERSLIDYINELSGRSAAPTPAMVTAFASQLAGRAPGHCWVSRFVKRHRSELDSAYLQQYQISEDDIYNMNEKGFLLGRLNKVRRIFSKDLKGSGKLLRAARDGSRDWLTVVATTCANGTALAPLLIYQSEAGNI
jgi:hypothetical protein